LGAPDLSTRVSLAVDASGLARLEAAAVSEPAAQVALAWHLRQRDTARAVAIANSAAAALPADAVALRARLGLVRAEAAWLRAELDAAAELNRQAQLDMQRAGDHAGLSDTTVLQAIIAAEQGDRVAMQRLLGQARAQATEGGEPVRAQAADAMSAHLMGYGDVDQAERQWSGAMAALQASPESVVAMWAWDFRAQIEYRRGRYVEGIAALHEAYQHALAAGQVRRAVIACINIGGNYCNLNDNEAALHWITQGMQLAQPTGWPGVNGAGLQLLCRVLAELGQLQAAREAVDEALRLLLPLAGSTTARQALFQASHLATLTGDHQAAATGLRRLVVDFQAEGDTDMVQKSRLELAPALAHVGQHEDALAEAGKALEMARSDQSAMAEIDALVVAAEVHAIIARRTAGPATAHRPRPGLGLLLQAVDMAAGITNYVMPASTWDQLAAEYAWLGEPAQAYAMACQAGRAREQVRQQQTSNRALALAAQMEIERRQIERERLHEQAALSAQRAELLQSTHATLAQLGRIGQELTAQLDLDTVFERVHGHLHSMVDAAHLAIWLVDEDAKTLQRRFGVEAGVRLKPAGVAVQSESSLLARCLRQECEIEHTTRFEPAEPDLLPRTTRMRSVLFGPLQVRGRAVGVMSIGSQRSQAYTQRERLVFRALCAFGAVAFGNAAAYADLSRVRAHLQAVSDAERQARHQAQQATLLKNEFLTHISGVLRKPLGALHETLLKLPQANPSAHAAADRWRMQAALDQCREVNTLARDLLELARLESGAARMLREPFSMADLTQDVLHKLDADARRCGQHLSSTFAAELPDVLADIAMIEHLLSAFVRFALRRLPTDAQVQVHLAGEGDVLRVVITGLAAGLRAEATPQWSASRTMDDGDLALAIARQMLLLHGTQIEEHTLGDLGDLGIRLRFKLEKAPA
jgi:tetratricopeptide (TPR) repeat protein